MARRPAGALHFHVAAPTGRGGAPEKMNLSNHRSWLAAVAVLAIAPVTAPGAVFDITVDSPTELSGNFQLFGFGNADEHPTLFSALPVGANTFRVVRDFGSAFVFTTATGTPDHPRINAFGSQGPFFASGRYDNGGLSRDISVDWSIQFINYNPSSNDRIEGRFSFTVAAAPGPAVPEPAETAVAVGAGLVAIAAVRRSRRSPVRTGA